MSFRVPYLVGNTRGQDHPNWPTMTRAALHARIDPHFPLDVDSYYLGNLDLATIMNVVALVKKWSVTGSGSGKVSIDYPDERFVHNDVLHFDVTMNINITSSSFQFTDAINALPDELALISYSPQAYPNPADLNKFYEPLVILESLGFFGAVGTNNYTWNITYVTGSGLPPDSGSGSTNLVRASLLVLNLDLYGYPFIPCDSGIFSFYSQEGISAGLNATLFPHNAGRQNSGDNANVSIARALYGVSPIGTATWAASIGGFMAPLSGAGSWPTDSNDGPGTGSNFSGTLSVAPTEFFAYKNSQGNPIYNTTTGAQLNNPFS